MKYSLYPMESFLLRSSPPWAWSPQPMLAGAERTIWDGEASDMGDFTRI